MSYTVLYIEDNPSHMSLVQREMEARGYTFIRAETGNAGVQMAEIHQPNVILLDINLPDIDGYEVAKKLRQSGTRGLLYTPIIAIMSNGLHGDIEKALEAGCDVYMSKPINMGELWAQVEAFLPHYDK